MKASHFELNKEIIFTIVIFFYLKAKSNLQKEILRIPLIPWFNYKPVHNLGKPKRKQKNTSNEMKKKKKKPYLRRGNGVISFSLIEERRNQQPQQQRYSAGFSEHAYFLSFSRYLMSLSQRNSVTTEPDWTRLKFRGRQSLFVGLMATGKFFMFE